MNKIAICDDEKIQIEILKNTIHDSGLFEARNTEVHTFESGVSLITAVRKGVVFDYIFLDINMPEKNGFQTYEELKITETTKVVFVSTHTEKLPEVSILRAPLFLHKPYNVDTLCRTIHTITTLQKKEYIFTYVEDKKEYTVSSKEIRYIQVINHDILALTDKPMPIQLSRISLDTLTVILEPYGFFRCQRSYLINFDYFHRHDNKYLYLLDGKKQITIPLSREKNKTVAGAFLKHKMREDNYGG